MWSCGLSCLHCVVACILVCVSPLCFSAKRSRSKLSAVRKTPAEAVPAQHLRQTSALRSEVDNTSVYGRASQCMDVPWRSVNANDLKYYDKISREKDFPEEKSEANWEGVGIATLNMYKDGLIKDQDRCAGQPPCSERTAGGKDVCESTLSWAFGVGSGFHGYTIHCCAWTGGFQEFGTGDEFEKFQFLLADHQPWMIDAVSEPPAAAGVCDFQKLSLLLANLDPGSDDHTLKQKIQFLNNMKGDMLRRLDFQSMKLLDWARGSFIGVGPEDIYRHSNTWAKCIILVSRSSDTIGYRLRFIKSHVAGSKKGIGLFANVVSAVGRYGYGSWWMFDVLVNLETPRKMKIQIVSCKSESKEAKVDTPQGYKFGYPVEYLPRPTSPHAIAQALSKGPTPAIENNNDADLEIMDFSFKGN